MYLYLCLIVGSDFICDSWVCICLSLGMTSGDPGLVCCVSVSTHISEILNYVCMRYLGLGSFYWRVWVVLVLCMNVELYIHECMQGTLRIFLRLA